MKRLSKISLSLVLVVTFFVACFLGMMFLYVANWLNGYAALTGRELVAEIVLSSVKEDGEGKFIEVKYTPVQQQTALVDNVLPARDPSLARGNAQEFKIYGDSVHIGGPVVKFYDQLVLLNYKTVYKVAKIYGRYNLDNEEQNTKKTSAFDLNGGIDPFWYSLNENEAKFPYNLFVDYVQLSTPGELGTNSGETREYDLYAGINGFEWVRKQN